MIPRYYKNVSHRFSNKKILSFLILLFIICSVLISCKKTEEDIPGIIDSTDYVFDEAILSESEIHILETLTGKNIAEITQNHLDRVNSVNIVGNNITKKEYMQSYSSEGYVFGGKLYSYEENIGDSVSALKYFKNIETLGIYFNSEAADFSFISNLTELKNLTLVMTSAVDLTFLSSLGKLENLEIRCAPLTKIAFNQDCNLKNVILNNLEISDAAIFAGQSGIINLSIKFNRTKINNLEVLQSITSLKSLSLVAPECDFSFLGEMPSGIKQLEIGGKGEIDLNVISKFTSLESFTLHESSGSDLRPLDSLPAGCYITTVFANITERGLRTSGDSENYTESKISFDPFDWYYENK